MSTDIGRGERSNKPVAGTQPGILTRVWQRGAWRVAGVAVVALVAVGAGVWTPSFLAPLRSNAPLLFPAFSIIGLCLYAGFPHKHMKLPSLDAMVVVGMASLVILEGLETISSLWGTAFDKASALGSLVLVAAGIKALQRGFVMADEQHEEPHRDDGGGENGSRVG